MDGIYHIAVISVLLCLELVSASSAEWGYEGDEAPSHWSENYPDCAGKIQSPVDIVTKDVLIDPSLPGLRFEGYGQTLSGGEFWNNGHSVQLSFPPNKTFRLYGGGKGSTTYRALQLHFHWAKTGSNDGSEHTINEKHYPVEMHIVHIKDPYNTTEQIKDMSDGLAVIGVFLEVGNETNLAFKKLLKSAKKCIFADSTSPLRDGPTLFSLLPESGSYYRYPGSLTSPPCFETVSWTVMQHPVSISKTQLRALQMIKSVTAEEAGSELAENTDVSATNNGLGGNYRPTQPLYGRIVTSHLDVGFYELGKSHGWTYHDRLTGTSTWTDTYSTCGKSSQSPINFVSTEARKPPGGSTALVFNDYGEEVTGSFFNNGHSVQVNIDQNLGCSIEGAELGASYKALQLHFHWGEAFADGTVTGGSEHTLDSERFPAELHIVHGKTSEIDDLGEYSGNHADAYAVLGIFIEVRKSDSNNHDEGENPNMKLLFNAMQKVIYAGNETRLSTGPPLESILPAEKSFYRYNGSLTTPACTESVIWNVFAEPIEISYNQFLAFQQLFSVESDEIKQQTSIKRMSEEAMVVEGMEKEESAPESDMAETRAKEALDSLTSASDGASHGEKISNQSSNFLLRNNYRPVQGLNGRTVYYYDSAEYNVTPTSEPTTPGLPVLQIVLFSILGIIVFGAMVAIVLKCFCKKKEKKPTSYTAGTKEEAVNL